MKQLLLAVLAAASLTWCTSAHAQNNQPTAKDKTQNKTQKGTGTTNGASMTTGSTMAYTPTYSSQFRMGNPAHSQMVLNLLKDYETNAFAQGSAFADTVRVEFADGRVITGLEKMTDFFKQARSSVPDIKMTIDAVMPVYSIDKKDDWVLVWGHSEAGGNRSDFHHLWHVNKAGKIDYLRMFESKPAME